jgi:hypothetical protein
MKAVTAVVAARAAKAAPVVVAADAVKAALAVVRAVRAAANASFSVKRKFVSSVSRRWI